MKAEEYDVPIILAMRFSWSYWEVQSLPNSFINELMARIEAANELKAKDDVVEDALSRMRAANQVTLRKLGLGKPQ